VTIEKYRFLQCGILTFLLPSDAYSNFVLRSKPEKNACVESIPIAFIAFPSLMLGFFNAHTFKVPVLLTSRKYNITINKPIMQKDTKIRVSFPFLFGLP